MPTPYDDEPTVDEQLAGGVCHYCGRPLPIEHD
jgi:hypothetical protein